MRKVGILLRGFFPRKFCGVFPYSTFILNFHRAIKEKKQIFGSKCYFTPPKSQFYDGIFYQVVKWFSRGLSRTLSGCIPPELARDGLQPRKVPDRPRENHFTTRFKIPELNWFFGWVYNFVQLNVTL